MEGRRRRAQRLAQNTEEQGQEILRQDEPQQDQTTLLDHPDQTDTGTTHRRRRQASVQEIQQEQALSRDERPIPQLPKVDEQQKARVIIPEPEKRTNKRAPKAFDARKLKQAADTAAKAGKMLLKGLGGLLVLGSIVARDGLKKGSEKIQKKRQGERKIKGVRGAGKVIAAEQAVELEPVRPEAYRGRGKAHTQNEAGRKMPAQHAKGKRSRNDHLINNAISALLLCVALFSAWQIGSIVIRSVRTTKLNDELSQQRAAIIEEQQTMPEEIPVFAPDSQPEITMQPVAETQQEPAEEPIEAQVSEAAVSVELPAPDVVKTMKYRQVGGDALPEMAALYEKNRDLVAWIQIPDVLDLPVVYRNNDYYLTRDFNKQKNASGTIFLDVNHPFKEKTQNLLLHGHNMKDGTMFGRLAQYLHDDSYLRNHPFIYFDTLWNKEQYVIFAVLDVSLKPSDERFFNYFTHDTFISDAEFSMYIRQLQLRSGYAIPIDVVPSDALLTLSTCLDDDRLVIVARRLRENETRSDLRALIRMATRQ